MEMKINASNTSDVQEMLDTVQKKARARLIDAADVRSIAHAAEAKLEQLNVNVASRLGCEVRVIPAKVCNSYNGRAEGTYVTIERFRTGWFIVYASRSSTGACSHGKSGSSVLSLSEAAHACLPVYYAL